MTSFQYTARDKTGNSASGTMEAESRQDLMRKLREKGLAPTSILEGRGAVAAKSTTVSGTTKPPRYPIDPLSGSNPFHLDRASLVNFVMSSAGIPSTRRR